MPCFFFLHQIIYQSENEIQVVRDSFPNLTLYCNEKWIINTCTKYFTNKSCLTIVNNEDDEETKLMYNNKHKIKIKFKIASKKIKDPIENLLKKLKIAFEHTTLEMLPHQQEMLDHMWLHCAINVFKDFKNNHIHESYLLYWLVGSGKTVGSLALFSNIHVTDIYILCTNSLILQWCAEILKLHQPKSSKTTFHIIGLTEFARIVLQDDENYLKDKIVIFDEAHMFRNISDIMSAQITALQKSKFLINLTGTPIYSDKSDIIGLALLHHADIKQQDEITLQEAKILINTVFKNHIHFYNPKKSLTKNNKKENYPAHIIIEKRVPMTWEQSLDYMFIKRATFTIDTLTFTSSSRNAYHAKEKLCASISKNGDCPKLDACVQTIIEFGQYPQLVIVEYLEDMQLLYQQLKSRNIQIEYAEGRTEEVERERIRQDYNNGKLQILILSPVGNVGWNLLGTKAIHLPNSYESLQKRTQATGRGLRLNSHIPDKDGNIEPVIIFQYIAIFPDPLTIPSNLSDYFYNTYCNPKKGDKNTWIDFNFNNELLKKMQKEENYKTIDEKLQVSIVQKFINEVEPLLRELEILGTLCVKNRLVNL